MSHVPHSPDKSPETERSKIPMPLGYNETDTTRPWYSHLHNFIDRRRMSLGVTAATVALANTAYVTWPEQVERAETTVSTIIEGIADIPDMFPNFSDFQDTAR